MMSEWEELTKEKIRSSSSDELAKVLKDALRLSRLVWYKGQCIDPEDFRFLSVEKILLRYAELFGRDIPLKEAASFLVVIGKYAVPNAARDVLYPTVLRSSRFRRIGYGMYAVSGT